MEPGPNADPLRIIERLPTVMVREMRQVVASQPNRGQNHEWFEIGDNGALACPLGIALWAGGIRREHIGRSYVTSSGLFVRGFTLFREGIDQPLGADEIEVIQQEAYEFIDWWDSGDQGFGHLPLVAFCDAVLVSRGAQAPTSTPSLATTVPSTIQAGDWAKMGENFGVSLASAVGALAKFSADLAAIDAVYYDEIPASEDNKAENIPYGPQHHGYAIGLLDSVGLSGGKTALMKARLAGYQEAHPGALVSVVEQHGLIVGDT